MRYTALLLALLAACSPALNWRTVRSDAHPLQMLLPCKPDSASREVPMVGQTVLLDMQGCEAAGATFAVSHVRLVDPTQAAAALAGWQTATLAQLHAQPSQAQPFAPHLSWALPQAQRLHLAGQRANGQPLQAQAVWFARIGPVGVDIYHALVLADTIDPAVADTFFASLKLP